MEIGHGHRQAVLLMYLWSALISGCGLAIGLIDGSIPWLTSPKLALLSVVMAHVWTQIPFAVVLIMAALAAINPETLEAAAIDCRSPVRRFRHVIFPEIRAMVVVLLIYNALTAFTLGSRPAPEFNPGVPVPVRTVLPNSPIQTTSVSSSNVPPLTPGEAAKSVSSSPTPLSNWRAEGYIPAFAV